MRLINPNKYLPPSYDTIDDLCKEKKIELDEDGKDFVIDMASKYAGGNFYEPDYITRQIDDKLDTLSRKHKFNSYNQRENFIKNQKYHLEEKKVVCSDVLQNVDLNDIHGQTPIERAINFTYILNKLGFSKDAAKRTESFLKIKNLDKAIKDFFDIDSLSEVTNEFFDLKLDVICTISDKIDIVIPMMGNYIKKKDPEGKITEYRRMKSYDELRKIRKRRWAEFKFQKDLFWLKLANKEFDIRERLTKECKKQIVFLLIDSSGSMNSGERFQKALGVLLNRIKAVKRKEAEVYFALFDTKIHEIHEVINEEDCEKALALIKKKPSGGGTYTDRAIKAAIEFINNKLERKDLLKPELIVITDEDGSVSNITKNNLNNVKIHGITVTDYGNQYLKKLAESNQGMYLQI